MRPPVVSVLIPAYNAERWLAESLASVFAQTYSNLEIVLIDDGSTDGTLELARSYDDPRLRVLTQPNAGLCATQNRAFRESTGDLIQYLDADDLLDPDKVRLQVERLAAEPEGTMASGPWTRFTDTIEGLTFHPDAGWRDFTPALGWFLARWPKPLMFPSFAWLTPRSVIERAGPWNENVLLNRDGEFFTRVVAEAPRLVFVEGAKSYYRSGLTGSLSKRRDRPALESLFRTCQLQEEAILSKNNSAEARRACAAEWQSFAYRAYPAAPDLVRKAEARAKDLGGTPWVPESGRAFNLIRDTVGWKAAAILQRAYYVVRYRTHWRTPFVTSTSAS